MTTRLPVDEVVRRLRAVVPQFMSFPVPTGVCPVVGRVGDHSCVLHLRRNFLRNPGNDIRVLDLKFFTVPEGTLLQGQFRFPWSLWLTIPFSVAIAIIFINLYISGDLDDAGFGKYFTVAVFIVALVVTVYSIWNSRTAELQIEEFLRDALGESSRS
jgi:hypothetical protein